MRCIILKCVFITKKIKYWDLANFLKQFFLERASEVNGIPACKTPFSSGIVLLFFYYVFYFFFFSSRAIRRDLPALCKKFLVPRISANVAKCCYYNSGSTRARTITAACVLVNMCHIRFTLTGRKEGRENRNAAGINIELGSPFLQGISCLVKRWRSDRELWHSVLSHLGGCYSWKHTQRPLPSPFFGEGRSSVCECKLPRRSHITHFKPECLSDNRRFGFSQPV